MLITLAICILRTQMFFFSKVFGNYKVLQLFKRIYRLFTIFIFFPFCIFFKKYFLEGRWKIIIYSITLYSSMFNWLYEFSLFIVSLVKILVRKQRWELEGQGVQIYLIFHVVYMIYRCRRITRLFIILFYNYFTFNQKLSQMIVSH